MTREIFTAWISEQVENDPELLAKVIPDYPATGKRTLQDNGSWLRALTRPLLRYIDSMERAHKDDMLTVVVPEFVPARWWQHLLHNQSSLMLKGALLFKEGIIVTNVPYHLEK